MQQRVAAVRASTVRVFVGDEPAGSGFVVRSTGLIATCFHVVQHVTPAPNGQVLIQYKSNITVEIPGHGRLAATPHPACCNAAMVPAISADFALLTVTPRSPLTPVAVGSFGLVQEGDDVYICGHPMGIEQSVVARGLLSTKWSSSGYLGVGGRREVAWLDLTQNKGNSGGPLLRCGPTQADDRVVGIASFGLNPFADRANEVVRIATTTASGAQITGIDFKQFAALVGTALSFNSVGVSGAVSIDYLQQTLAANSL